MPEGQSIAALRSAILQLRQKVTAATTFLEQLKCSYHKATAEAERWNRRTELAQQHNRFDLFLAASEQANRFVHQSEMLQNRMERHSILLRKLESQLAAAEKRLSNLKQIQETVNLKKALELPPLSFNEPNLVDIEAVEQKLEQVLRLSQEALAELQALKAKL